MTHEESPLGRDLQGRERRSPDRDLLFNSDGSERLRGDGAEGGSESEPSDRTTLGWQVLIWVYYLLGVLFLAIGLLLIRWERDIPGLVSILLAACLIWIGESSFQAYKRSIK